MFKNRSMLIFGIFSLVALLTFPDSTHAEETFSPTVEIIGYRYLLNGQVTPLVSGSGTLISSEGEILTNAHVIMNADLGKPLDAFSICVSETPKNPPDCRFTATVKRVDTKIDLALLQVNKTPVWGSFPSSFPYLAYDHALEPGDGDTVTVRGFPSSGGITINTTKGQISGFEQYNGFTYLKTDADIDTGNSGGTMLDENGNFIGVPTYVVSNLETSGRALDITEVSKWIKGGAGLEGKENVKAESKLRSDLKHLNEEQQSGEISLASYPGLKVTIPTGWQMYERGENGFFLGKDSNYIQVIISNNIFKLDSTPAEDLRVAEKFLLNDVFKNAKNITINGRPGIDLWGSDAEGIHHNVYFRYGYSTVDLYYLLASGEGEETKKEIENFLSGVQFSFPDQDDPNPKQLLDEADYPFSIQVPTAWRITKNESANQLLGSAARKIKSIEQISLNYTELPQSYTHATTEENLNYDLENHLISGATVSFKSADVKLDGLPGWMYIYDYPLGKGQMKMATVAVLDPEYAFYFTYNAEAEVFDAGFKAFMSSLKTFKSKRYNTTIKPEWAYVLEAKNKGIYNIPEPVKPLEVYLSDIAGHRYEQSIKNLVALGVITGNPDGTFKPEDLVNRAAALKLILQSLRAEQIKNGEVPFVMPADFHKFSDVTPDLWFATYVAEGVDKKIIEGYPDGTFKGGNTVILAEALKMALVAHKANVWSGTTEPWYKKYFDAANQLSLLPNDLQDPAHPLTRAELAYIVDQLVTK